MGCTAGLAGRGRCRGCFGPCCCGFGRLGSDPSAGAGAPGCGRLVCPCGGLKSLVLSQLKLLLLLLQVELLLLLLLLMKLLAELLLLPLLLDAMHEIRHDAVACGVADGSSGHGRHDVFVVSAGVRAGPGPVYRGKRGATGPPARRHDSITG